MNKEEIEELKDFTIDITDIDELALGLEVCSKKSNMVIQEFANLIIELQQQNKMLKKQLEYLKSGEYYNQLRFERDVLQNIVFNGEISKEDKEFIDMTHRNTELLEENKQLKEQNEKEFADYIKFKQEQYDEHLEKINKLIKEKQHYKFIIDELEKWLMDENNQKYSKDIWNYSVNSWVLTKLQELKGDNND